MGRQEDSTSFEFESKDDDDDDDYDGDDDDYFELPQEERGKLPLW